MRRGAISTADDRFGPQAVTAKSTAGWLACAMLMSACNADINAELVFEARYDGERVGCDQPFGPARSMHLTDLRFYVAEISARNDAGVWTRAVPVDSPTGVILIDLEDGTGACVNGSTATNDRVLIAIPDGHYDAIRFTLGVPFDRNHADPLTAEHPLDTPAMHWHWQSGYKFIRAGVEVNHRRWHVHLGSTGCRGPATAVSACQYPNRALAQIENWSRQRPVVVALDALLEGIVFDAEPSGHCLGETDNPACRIVLQNLGIAAHSGLPTGAAAVFGSGNR